jgi:NADH:ubiquinone oxidoreductase subunit F (NADH-binding)
VGTEKAVKMVEGESGSLSPAVESRLAELHRTLERTSICGLGQVALAPLLSIVERFPVERDRLGDG